jgi:hypothetical protein
VAAPRCADSVGLGAVQSDDVTLHGVWQGL